MHSQVYISGCGIALPNAPVPNDRIEDVLGPLPQVPAGVRRRILMNNGILLRHYAIDPQTGRQTHTNAALTAEAIRALARTVDFDPGTIDCLACGTSSPDQFIPSHGSMVHAELGSPPCEVVTTAGVCCSGMSALKYGYLNVASGNASRAVVTGSEIASPSLTARHFASALELKRSDVGKEPMLAFENAFLRWMLSDGAGAFLLTPSPEADTSLRIDWIDILSYASQSEVCMYYGMQKDDDGTVRSYRGVTAHQELYEHFHLAQDVTVLKRIPELMSQAVDRIRRKRDLSGDRIDWLLPHYSSQWFRKSFYDGLVQLGMEIPIDRWFTNLTTRGNTGSAAMYIILEELLSSGRLRSGQRILCMIPESARMTFALVHLTVA